MNDGNSNGSGLAVAGPEAARSAAPAPDGLPCQNKNNCIKTSSPKYKFETVGDGVFKDSQGRTFVELKGEGGQAKYFNFDELSSNEAKTALTLRGQVSDFFSFYGRNHVAFFTATCPENIDPREFKRRFHSWMTNVGSKFIVGYILVLEPQIRGAPHVHLIVAVEWDMTPDQFDWVAFNEASMAYKAKDWPWFRITRAKYVASTPKETREIWKLCRTTMPRYSLGRAEFLPIRKEAEAMSEYIGKYLEAGTRIKIHEWKGVRRIERDRIASRQWNNHHRAFAWVSPGATAWRRRVGELAIFYGFTDYDQFKKRLGPKWAYRWRKLIVELPDEEWREMLSLNLTM